jgi:hypothetical protein
MGADAMNSLPDGFVLDSAAPAAPPVSTAQGSAALPDGFQLDQQPSTAAAKPAFGSDEYAQSLADKYNADPKYVSGMIDAQTNRAGLAGIPVAGAFVNQAGAAAAAAAHSLTGAGSPGDTFNQRYTKNLALQNELAADYGKAHPIEDTAAGLIGGTVAMAPLGATAAGAKALGLAGDSLPGMMWRGGASGAAIGGTDAAARGENPITGAAMGGTFGLAGPVGGRIVGGITRGLAGTNAPTAEALDDAASAAYRDPTIDAVQFKPDAIGNLADSIRTDLNSNKLNVRRAPDTHGLLDDLSTPINGNTFTVDDLETTRQLLGKTAGNFTDPVDQTAAVRAKQMIDNYLGNVPQSDLLTGDANAANATLQSARGNYAAMMRSNTLQGQLDRGELNAAVANSGQNLDNALRQRVKAILVSPSQRSGFSPDEIVQMQRVARGTPTGNTLRFVGNLLGGGGGLGAVVSGAAGYATAGPAGALVPAVGLAAKKLAAASTQRQAAILDQMVRARSPLGSAMPQPNQQATALAAMRRAALASRILQLPAYRALQANTSGQQSQ